MKNTNYQSIEEFTSAISKDSESPELKLIFSKLEITGKDLKKLSNLKGFRFW